jgi:hypothetical protein
MVMGLTMVDMVLIMAIPSCFREDGEEDTIGHTGSSSRKKHRLDEKLSPLTSCKDC